jgi:O-phospho-L-seryl-tRNASec:L-selenocysteinyl-tRNA synthase
LLNAIKICGLTHIRHVQIMPLATGMTLMMCMLALKSKNPAGKYVIWPRIDQKSCFKSIVSANLIPLVVENILLHDELVTDMESIEELLKAHGKEVLCVLATTSCFAPRNPDKIDKIAILCKTYGIPQVVNNAYGVQCRSICKLINRAMTVGRVDYVISSLDKNFLVPVGGAFIGAITAEDVALVSRFYPGRASLGPTLDLFITLLSMGKQQLLSLLHTREELMLRLVEGTDAIAATYGERRLVTTCNPISIALSLNSIASSPYDATFLGSMLFQRCVSGVRVVPLGAEATVSGHVFVGWGAQCRSYHCSYMTVACALGMTADEVTAFLEKLGKIFAQLKSKASNKAP